MNNKFWQLFIISLIIHIIAASFLFHQLKQVNKFKQLVDVSIVPNSPLRGQQHVSSATQIDGKSRKPKQAKRSEAINLFQKVGFGSKNLGTAENLKGAAAPSVLDGYDVAESISFTDSVKYDPFFQALLKRIDEVVDYPDDFVRFGTFGSVTIQIEVDRQGIFTGRLVKVDSASDLLAAYTTAISVLAFRQPLPERLPALG